MEPIVNDGGNNEADLINLPPLKEVVLFTPVLLGSEHLQQTYEREKVTFRKGECLHD